MMRNGLAILAVLGFAALARGDFETDGDLDHSASSATYTGAIFRVGADGAATSRMFVGGHDTPQPTDVNTPISGTVNVTLDAGITADLNLGLLIVGGAGGRQNVGTLKFNQTDVTIDANAIWFGYCHNKANRNPEAYVTFDGADVTINVGEFRHGWASGDGSERYVQTRHVNGGSFTLNVANHIKQGYHSPVIEPTGYGIYETMTNYIDLNGADKVVIAVGGSWYIGTGRGGSGEFRSDACTDLTVSIAGTLKLGGTNPDSTDARNHLAIAKFGTAPFWWPTVGNVTAADVRLNGSGRRTTSPAGPVGPSQLELHGTHMDITNSLAIDVGDYITLFYDGSEAYQTWLRMPDVGTNAATLTTMIADGRILADVTGTPPAGALGVYLRDGFAYVGLMASAPAPPIPGDADLNGYVDLPDLIALARNWHQGTTDDPAAWGQGNFDGDHIVDLPDLIILARNWHAGTPPPAGASGEPDRTGAVPEPACLTLLAIGGLALMRRRPKV